MRVDRRLTVEEPCHPLPDPPGRGRRLAAVQLYVTLARAGASLIVIGRGVLSVREVRPPPEPRHQSWPRRCLFVDTLPKYESAQ